MLHVITNFWQEITKTNTEEEWLMAAAVFVSALIIQLIIKKFVFARLTKFAEMTKGQGDDLLMSFLNSINGSVFLITSLYFSFKYLTLPGWLDIGLNNALLFVGICYGLLLVHKIINFASARWLSRSADSGNNSKDFIILIRKMTKVVLWLMASMFYLSNSGVDITAMIASLGVGGLAFGLGAQSTIKDFISALRIFITKPFKLGDTIKIDGITGEVIDINWDSIKLKPLFGHIVIVPNQKVTGAIIENFATLKRRREAMTINVHSNTSVTKLDKALEIIEAAIKKHEMTEFGRVHYNVFGTCSVEFDVVFHITPKDYNEYKDVMQAIGKEVRIEFEKESIKLAIPAQEVFISKEVA